MQPLFRFVLLMLLLAGCSGGAVVFAPTAPPPDLSPLRYTHPSGAFSVVVPRTWSLYEQNTTTLASASFAAPGTDEPAVLFTLMNPGVDLSTTQAFGDVINQYQTQVRPDLDRYKEQSRQAMGDGSWRMTGLRTTPVGVTQQVNTFIERTERLIGIADVVLSEDAAAREQLQTIVNSFEMNADATLDAAPLSSLTAASPTALSILHVASWTTPTGVFFITGEVANYGSTLATNIPIRAVLLNEDGLSMAEAVDTVMGYGVAPGGFAPFSLRFGQGQPARTADYVLTLGGADWQPDAEANVIGQPALRWTDESTLTDSGQLLIRGTVENTGDEDAREVRVVVSVFDAAQRVIASGFVPLDAPVLAPDESASFQLVLPEMGGQPANYIVTAQGLP